MAKGNSKPFGKSGSNMGSSTGGLKPNKPSLGKGGGGGGMGGNGVKPKAVSKKDIGKVF